MEEATAHAAANGPDLVSIVALLAAGVVAVPLFKRIGLGSVLGYLTAGIVIGPFGLGLFHDPQTILHAAELGFIHPVTLAPLSLKSDVPSDMQQLLSALAV